MLINKLLIRKNINLAFLLILITVSAVVVLYLIVLKGYPQLNDIGGILKISALPGNQKWINGFFGPGYTYLSIIFNPKVSTFALIYGALIIISTYISYKVSVAYTENKNVVETLYSYTALISYFSITLFELRLNYSDGIFILLLYDGLMVFIYGNYMKKTEH